MKNKGITLIALIVTVIIMIILAGISIRIITNGGIIDKTKEAAFKEEYAMYLEEFKLYKATGEELFDTWKYEDLKKFITILPESVRMGEEDCRIGVVEGKLWYKDENETRLKWAEEIGYNVILLGDSTIRMEVTGEGTVEGIEVNEDIVTKIGKEYKVTAIPKTKNIQGKTIDYEFAGWYKNGKLLSKETEYTIKVALPQENYEARFETDPTLIYLEDGSIIIDDSVTLGGYANREDIVKVEIGRCVKTISESAFENCINLIGTLVIREGMALGGKAFNGSGIEKVIIGNEVDIPAGSFSNCSNLEEVIVGDNVIFEPGYYGNTGILNNCEKLKKVSIGENVKIKEPNPTTSLGGITLCGRCPKLEEVTVKSVSEVGRYAFQNVGVALKGDILINEGVTSIGQSAFSGCGNIENLTLPSTLETINYSAFSNCKNMKYDIAKIPEKVNTIEGLAFNNCTNLSGILTIEKTISFGGNTFNGSGIEKVIIGNEVDIPAGSFSNCSNLEEVIVGDNVIFEPGYYGNTGILNNCEKLKKVSIGENVKIKEPYPTTSLGGITLCGRCPNLEEVTVKSVSEVGRYAFQNIGVALKGDIVINEGVTTIGAHAFLRCSNVENLVLPSTLETINYSAFSDCKNMKYDMAKIPEKVNTIEGLAFNNCTNLSGILAIKEAMSWGGNAFNGSGIEKLIIENGINIQANSFNGCYRLEEIVLGDGVKITGGEDWENKKSGTFSNCPELKKITMGENIEMLCTNTTYNYSFQSCGKLEEVTVKSLANVAPKAFTFIGSALKGEIKINEGITEIGANAFDGCTNITSVSMPSTLEQIENSAFYHCTGVEKMNFNMTKEEFENNVTCGSNWHYGISDEKLIFKD